MKKEKILEDFFYYLASNMNYWLKQTDTSEKERMQGMIFSILVCLDGCSGNFNGSIEDIEKASRGIQLHEMFYAPLIHEKEFTKREARELK